MVTVLPSPSGVGVMALTSTSLPAGLGRLEQLEAEFALVVTVRMELVRRDGEALGQRVNGETGDWREISISLSISTSLACQVKYAAQSSGINRVIQ